MAAFFAIDIAEFPKDLDGLHLDYVSKFMFSISAAIVLPLVILAFRVNEVSAISSKFATSIVKHMRDVVDKIISNMKSMRKGGKGVKNPPPVDSGAVPAVEPQVPLPGAKSENDTETKRTEATTSAKRTNNEQQNVILSMIGYLFVVLPLEELRFAFDLPEGLRKRMADSSPVSRTQDVQAQDAHTRAEENEGKGVEAKVSLPPESTILTGTVGDVAQEWRLKIRPGVRDTAYAIFAIIRLCILPLGMSLLFVDFVLLVVLCGVACLLFQDIHFGDVVRLLRGLWVSQEKTQRKRKKDAVIHAEEGRQSHGK
ncbi:hypothetical protein K469DRAFT_780679 [Zopfia rhizophila CBS 207.26]|uniref:Uncharacterized protein n=1 Tax=Zopfia rhizophila CBS 207.26 TaxID=1314779 RepID=A0A6A6E1N4_9PEZI|nr:hypothetical protein K469DRAFT_780679 [Zopfia rhizophila CBS 207.26]